MCGRGDDPESSQRLRFWSIPNLIQMFSKRVFLYQDPFRTNRRKQCVKRPSTRDVTNSFLGPLLVRRWPPKFARTQPASSGQIWRADAALAVGSEKKIITSLPDGLWIRGFQREIQKGWGYHISLGTFIG